MYIACMMEVLSDGFPTIHCFSSKLNIDFKYCKTLSILKFISQIEKFLRQTFCRTSTKLGTATKIQENFLLSLKLKKRQHRKLPLYKKFGI